MRLLCALALAWMLAVGTTARADGPLTVDLWPGTPPGPARELPGEGDTTTPSDPLVAGRPVIRLGNVSTPQIVVYRPPPDLDTGAAAIICPGGGYHILAYDLEGTEVAEWLNTLGITGILLKYRVPAAPGSDRGQLAQLDLRRALALARERSSEWGVDPDRIGIIGFSAGGHAAALATLAQSAEPDFPRPAFAILIYAGGWLHRDSDQILNGLAVTADTPPLFISQADDDPYEKMRDAAVLAQAAHAAGCPVALHVFATGGHGYGLRPGGSPAARWSDLAADWLRAQGMLDGHPKPSLANPSRP